MAVPSPVLEALAGRPVRDDAPFGLDNEEERENEDTTRAVSREEMMGLGRQDAQVVVGAGAVGDDATLALAPGQANLGIGGAIAAELAASVLGDGPRQSAPVFPGFPEPHHPPFHTQPNYEPQPQPHGYDAPAHRPGSQPFGARGSPGAPPPASWRGEAAPSYRNPPSMGGAYDPAHGHPQSSSHVAAQGYPASGQHPAMAPAGYAQGPQSSPDPRFGSNPNMQVAQPYPPNVMPSHMQAGPQGWPPQPPNPGASPPSKLTPQTLGLIVVGVICVAIFIVGIVLFVTARF